jgi:hypothetical protein
VKLLLTHKNNELIFLGGEDFMILDRTAQKIEELRRNLHDQVTANRGGREKWQNIQTEQVEIEVCGLDAVYYSQRSAVDIDRLAQAAIAQGDFIRKTRGGLPVTQGDETLYRSFDHFSMDATLCLFGRNGYKKPMSKSEELAIGWAVFNHANWPKEFIVFGRNEDRLHSGIVSKYEITSEYFQGGILNPEKWNPFINDCWALGGIKAGNAFMPVTDFMSLSRKVCYQCTMQYPCMTRACVFRYLLHLTHQEYQTTLGTMTRSLIMQANHFTSL